MRDLHDEELRALLAFRQRHGRRWKAALLLRWSAGADLDEPGSPHLRRLLGLSVAALDDAAERLVGGIDQDWSRHFWRMPRVLRAVRRQVWTWRRRARRILWRLRSSWASRPI